MQRCIPRASDERLSAPPRAKLESVSQRAHEPWRANRQRERDDPDR
jgi:hypothetical protein